MRIRWRGLELPSLVAVDRSSLTPTYGKFTAEPFERGFGVTIGNSLRRILLSSLEGSAITQIKLHGAQHEFSTLPGVLEDVTDIVARSLNAETVHSALNALPPAQREVIRLAYLEGLTRKEISQQLGQPLGEADCRLAPEIEVSRRIG